MKINFFVYGAIAALAGYTQAIEIEDAQDGQLGLFAYDPLSLAQENKALEKDVVKAAKKKAEDEE